MLFRWEEYTHQIILLVMLAISAVLAIVINQTNLTGNKKLKLFQQINRFSIFFIVPASLYMLVVQIVALAQSEYISMDNSTWRFILVACSLAIGSLGIWRLIPLTTEGIRECKKKSITASKYERIFKKLRASFMAIMIIIIFSYWMNYLFIR